jgi:hypothetical protein
MRVQSLTGSLIDLETSRSYRGFAASARVPEDFGDGTIRRAEIYADNAHRTGRHDHRCVSRSEWRERKFVHYQVVSKQSRADGNGYPSYCSNASQQNRRQPGYVETEVAAARKLSAD